MTVQQYIPLHPHDMPCITIITNMKISVRWVIPMQRHVSTAVKSTHCEPQECDMSKEPLSMSPLKVECLPPQQCLQLSEVVPSSAQRSCGQLLVAPPLIVVLQLHSLSCDRRDLSWSWTQPNSDHKSYPVTLHLQPSCPPPLAHWHGDGGLFLTPHLHQHQLHSKAGFLYDGIQIHFRYYHFWLHRWVHHPAHGAPPYVIGYPTNSTASS